MPDSITSPKPKYPPFSQLSQALIRSGLWASLRNESKAVFPVLLVHAHIIEYVTPAIKLAEIAELSGISIPAVKRGISELKALRIIDSFGPKSHRQYTIQPIGQKITGDPPKDHGRSIESSRVILEQITGDPLDIETKGGIPGPNKGLSIGMNPAPRDYRDMNRERKREAFPASVDVGNGQTSSPFLENILSELSEPWKP